MVDVSWLRLGDPVLDCFDQERVGILMSKKILGVVYQSDFYDVDFFHFHASARTVDGLDWLDGDRWLVAVGDLYGVSSKHALDSCKG